MTALDNSTGILQPTTGRASVAESSKTRYEEFRSKKQSPWVLFVIMAPVMYGILSASGAGPYSALGPIFSAAGAIYQYIVSGRYRLILSDDGLYVGWGRTARVAAWSSVQSALLVRLGKRLVLNVSDGKPIHIELSLFKDPDRIKTAVASFMGESVRIKEVRTETPSLPFYAIIATVLVTVAVLITLVFNEAVTSLWYWLYGLVGGLGVSIFLLVRWRSEYRKRTKLCLLSFAAVVVACALYAVFCLLVLRRFPQAMIGRAIVLVLGFGAGLFVPQAIAWRWRLMAQLNGASSLQEHDAQPMGDDSSDGESP